MRLLSPRGMLHHLRALVERPFHHRRQPQLGRTYQRPADAWWAGDERWFPGDTPPRQGNHLTPLIDGEQAMRAMYEAMDQARASIYIAAWFLTPELRLIRPPNDPVDPPQGKGGPEAFLTLIARKADEVDVRILMWPGSALGKFNHRRAKAAHRMLVRANPRLRARLDRHDKLSHCHHQKALVVDGRVAFVGGLDVTAFDADRWDVQAHTFREGRNWHDCHMKIEGPCVADVAANFVQRWNAVAPHDPAPLAPAPAPIAGGVEAQVQRTIARGVYPFAPEGIFGIAYAYLHAIGQAERFIYLESQYLWSPEIADALCDALRRGVHVVIVLPAHPNVGKADSDRHVEELLRADDGHGCFHPYTLYTSWYDEERQRYHYRPVYVHAKVAVIDDRWCTVGSANLNGRGMASDSEINVSTSSHDVARTLRVQLWAEHLSCPVEAIRDEDALPILTGRWADAAAEQQRIVQGRLGSLSAAIYPYPTGHVDADFGPGEIESALLDR